MSKSDLQRDMFVAMAQRVAAAMARWEIPPLTEEQKEEVQRYVNVMLTYQPCKVEDTDVWRRLPATLPFWGALKHRNAECEKECGLASCPLSHNRFEMRFHPLLYKQCGHIPGELCAVTQGSGRDVIYCGFYHDSEDEHVVELARYIALLHISQTSCPLGRFWRARMPQAYADLVKAKADFPRPRVNDYVYVMCCYKTVPCDAYLQGACCTNEWDCFDYHTMATRRRSPLVVCELAHEEFADRTGHKESKPENDPAIHITIERCSYLLYKRTPHGARQTCKIVERHHNPIFCPFLHDSDDKTALEDARSRVTRMVAAFLDKNPDVARAVEKAKQNPADTRPSSRSQQASTSRSSSVHWTLLLLLLPLLLLLHLPQQHSPRHHPRRHSQRRMKRSSLQQWRRQQRRQRQQRQRQKKEKNRRKRRRKKDHNNHRRDLVLQEMLSQRRVFRTTTLTGCTRTGRWWCGGGCGRTGARSRRRSGTCRRCRRCARTSDRRWRWRRTRTACTTRCRATW